MPRSHSSSRRQRTPPLNFQSSQPFDWRPRVSSPLATEVTFNSPEEKWPITENTTTEVAEELYIPRRPGSTQIGLSLIVDSLMSVWLCRVVMDSFLTLRFLLAAIPSPFNQPGTILFCNSNHHYLSPWDYPRLGPGESLSDLKELPANCVFLPELIVKIGQSRSLAGFIPLMVACAISLKLAFGYLLLRTSKRPSSPFTYLKLTVALHLLVAYMTFVYIHVHLDLLMHHYPRLENALRVSSECIFFLAGVTVCLCLLGIVVVPLLWICSSYTNNADLSLPTAPIKKPNDSAAHFNHHQQTSRLTRGAVPYKKPSLFSKH